VRYIVHFFVLDIVGLLESAEKAFDLVFKDRRTLLYDVLNVFENNILSFHCCKRNYRDNRWA